MKFVNIYIVAVDIVISVALGFVGLYIIFHKQKVLDALLASNRIFWNGIGLKYNETVATFMTNIIIPVMGFLFCCAGLLLFVKVIRYFWK